jgi:integrase
MEVPMRNESNARRRESVEGKPGIYVRTLADGNKKHEFSYTGSDGRRRWKMVEGGVRDAEKARRAVLAEIDKGGKVEPTNETFEKVATDWLARQEGRVRPRTFEAYSTAIRVHLVPKLGKKRLQEINEDDIARVIREMKAAGKRPWTIHGALTPLSLILGTAVRRGWIASNPMKRLEPGERPSVIASKEKRNLDRDEIRRLLDYAPARYRTALAVSVFTGLRQSELLGLLWEDVDLDAGLLNVRKQLSRKGTREEPKTKKAVREVVLPPFLVRLLREHKLASRSSLPSDFVFASTTGGPMHHRNVVRRGLQPALAAAGIAKPWPTWHNLRDTFASIVIAEGEDVVWLSRQLGHSKVSVTLDVYAYLFDRRRHAEEARSRLEAGYADLIGEHAREHAAPSPAVPATPAPEAEVAQLRGIGTDG